MPNLGTTPVWLELWNLSGQSYKQFTLVIYDSRVVIYECKLFIRLATVASDTRGPGFESLSFFTILYNIYLL